MTCLEKLQKEKPWLEDREYILENYCPIDLIDGFNNGACPNKGLDKITNDMCKACWYSEVKEEG